MKTTTVEVGQMVSARSASGVERRLASLPGVVRVDDNYVAGSAIVRYDDTGRSARRLSRSMRCCTSARSSPVFVLLASKAPRGPVRWPRPASLPERGVIRASNLIGAGRRPPARH